MAMATLKSEIDSINYCINELAKKHESMQYTLMKMMKNRMKKAMQKNEAQDRATKEQLDRI